MFKKVSKSPENFCNYFHAESAIKGLSFDLTKMFIPTVIREITAIISTLHLYLMLFIKHIDYSGSKGNSFTS